MASFIDFASSTNDGITVYVYGGDKYLVKLPESATVKDLRRHCSSLCKVNLSNYDLYYNNGYLLDSMKLAEKKITKGSTVVAKKSNESSSNNSSGGGMPRSLERRVSAPVMLPSAAPHQSHPHQRHSVTSVLPTQQQQQQQQQPQQPQQQQQIRPSLSFVSPPQTRHSFTSPNGSSSSSSSSSGNSGGSSGRAQSLKLASSSNTNQQQQPPYANKTKSLSFSMPPSKHQLTHHAIAEDLDDPFAALEASIAAETTPTSTAAPSPVTVSTDSSPASSSATLRGRSHSAIGKRRTSPSPLSFRTPHHRLSLNTTSTLPSSPRGASSPKASSSPNDSLWRASSSERTSNTHKQSVDNVTREITRLSLKLDDMESDIRRLREQGTADHKRLALQLEDLQNQYKTEISAHNLLKASLNSECAKMQAEVAKTKKQIEAAKHRSVEELKPIKTEMEMLKTKHKDLALRLMETNDRTGAEKKTLDKQLADMKRLVGSTSGQHDTHDARYVSKQQRDQFIEELFGVLNEYSTLKQEFLQKLQSSG